MLLIRQRASIDILLLARLRQTKKAEAFDCFGLLYRIWIAGLCKSFSKLNSFYCKSSNFCLLLITNISEYSEPAAIHFAQALLYLLI